MGGEDTNKYKFHYFTYTSKIKNFTYGKLKDEKGINKIKNFLEKEKFDIIHIHSVLGIDWDLYSILKPYKYIVSLHDYYYLCPRIDMVPEKNCVCGCFEENKCKKCISYIQRFRVCRFSLKKINKILHKDLKMPYFSQNITTIRYEKFKELLENAQYLLPVSSRVKEIYIDSNIKNRYKVLHIGNISADNFSKEYKYDTKPHKIKIVFLGRLSYSKGADLLIKIAERIDKEKFEIHFYGRPEGYENKLNQNSIINHGEYKQKELSNILEKFDLGFVLSVWEDNGPQVVMELLNNHVPVIGTKMGGIPDFVNKENGFIFDPYSEIDFNELLEFLNNLTIEKISKLKSNIKPTNTTKQHYKDIMNVYKEILSKN